MALVDVQTLFAEMLTGLDDVEEAPPTPLPQLPGTKTAWCYPIPGDSAPNAHKGAAGGLITQQTDAMVVEWHLKIDRQEVDHFLSLGVPMLDRLRNGIWGLSGQAVMIRSVRTTRFGELGWGTDFSYGIRLSVEFIHFDEVS